MFGKFVWLIAATVKRFLLKQTGKMNDTFLLFNAEYLPLLEKHLEKSGARPLVIVFNPAHGQALQKKYGTLWKYFADLLKPGELEEINRDAILWLHQWARRPVINGKSVAELFLFETANLFWVSGYLYMYADIINLVSTILLLDKLFSRAEISRVILPDVAQLPNTTSQLYLNDPNIRYQLLDQYCRKNNIPVTRLPVSKRVALQWRQKTLMDRIRALVFRAAFKSLCFLLRKRVAAGSRIAAPPGSKKPSAILLSPFQNWGRVFDLQSSKAVPGDTKVGYLYQYLRAKTEWQLWGVDTTSMEKCENAVLQQKISQDPFLNWTAPEYFLRFRDLAGLRVAKRKVIKTGNRLLREQDFQQSLQFGGISLFPHLKPRLRHVFRTALPDGLEKYRAYCRLIGQLQPAIFILSYETGLHGRAATYAAAKHNIPTLALQHGKIHGGHPQYVHPQVSTRQKPDPRQALLPDVTAVFGRETAVVLQKLCGYPAENIRITGQVATDALIAADKIYQPERFKAEHGLNKEMPVVCLLSQNFDSEADYAHFFQTAGEALSHIENANFLIKLHPRQNIAETEKAVRKHYRESDRLRVLKDVDLYEAIYCSDVLITGNSTVGLEVMLLKKPLITIEGFKYSMGYAESGAALGCHNSRELKDAIVNLLGNPAAAAELINAGQAFLKKHYYKIDGKVSQRIAQIMNELTGNDRNTDEKTD